MNIEQASALKDEDLLEKVAVLDGWRLEHKAGVPGGYPPRISGAYRPDVWSMLPYFTHDLNPMRVAVEELRYRDDDTWFNFGHVLNEICGSGMNCVQADARTRAIAFVVARTNQGE